jgi:flagellar protein FlaG
MIIQTTFNPMPSAATEARAGPPETAKAQVSTPVQAPPTEEPSREDIEAAVDSANRAPNVAAHNLKFRVDEQSERIVIKVVDKETGETVREIPPEEMLAIAESIERYQKGLLLSQEA